MAIYERGETYVHRVSIRNRNGERVTPSTVSLYIYDPCGKTILNSVSMTSDAVGEFFYNYALYSTATYGKYKTLVVATSASGIVTKEENKFYIMPWKLEKDIRQITGISETKSISDDDLSDIAWSSYKFSLRDVFIHHYRETPYGNPNTGVMFDGSNTSFQTKYYPIADINGDGSVSGMVSCATDVKGWWIDSTGHYNICAITVTTSYNGELTITQVGGAAIPSNHKGVFLDYWSEYDSFDSDLFHRAVAYLSAHEVVNRFNELDRVTLADLNTNRPVVLSNPKRFYYEYKRYANMIREPRVGTI